jgi:hypothetical protein
MEISEVVDGFSMEFINTGYLMGTVESVDVFLIHQCSNFLQFNRSRDFIYIRKHLQIQVLFITHKLFYSSAGLHIVAWVQIASQRRSVSH